MKSHRNLSLFVFLFIIFFLTAEAPAQVYSEQFHMTGPNKPVTSMITWQGDLIIGGSFSAVGPVPANNVARMVGSQWEDIGIDLDIHDILEFVVFENQLHALCRRTDLSTTGVYRFEGGQWTQVGNTLDRYPSALVEFHGQLYAGAYRLEGDVWNNVLDTDQNILDLVVHDDLLVAGGKFTSANGVPCGYVIAWDGTNFIDAYPGQTERVTGLAVWEGELFLSREATTYYYLDAAVQCWNDGAWVDIPELGEAHELITTWAMISTPQALIICGDYHDMIIEPRNPSRSSHSYIRSWNGESVQNIFTAYGFYQFMSIAFDGDQLYLGGGFNNIGEPIVNHIAKVEGNQLHQLSPSGLGANYTVKHLLPMNDGMVVGGLFQVVGDLVSQGVGYSSNSGQWESRNVNLTEHFDFQRFPEVLGMHYGTLYALSMVHAGYELAYWDGAQWEVTMDGWLPQIDELVSWHGLLLGYMGNEIYRFSGVSEPMVYLVFPDENWIKCSLIDDGDLVLGGQLPMVDGVQLNNVGRFDGSNWSAFGNGFSEPVDLLSRWQGDIVAVHGSGDMKSISRWEGSFWLALPPVNAQRIYALQEYNGMLFACGWFHLENGGTMTDLRYLHGDQWVSVGDFNCVVTDLAVSGGMLWVGGCFNMVNGIPASGVVTMTMDLSTVEDSEGQVGEVLQPVLHLASPSPNPFNPMTEVSFTLAEAGPVTLEVYNLKGELITTLMNGHQEAGPHRITWQGTDKSGRAMPSGSYLMRLDTGHTVRTTKATLVR